MNRLAAGLGAKRRGVETGRTSEWSTGRHGDPIRGDRGPSPVEEDRRWLRCRGVMIGVMMR